MALFTWSLELAYKKNGKLTESSLHHLTTTTDRGELTQKKGKIDVQ